VISEDYAELGRGEAHSERPGDSLATKSPRKYSSVLERSEFRSLDLTTAVRREAELLLPAAGGILPVVQPTTCPC
jgi:hypothetical protein